MDRKRRRELALAGAAHSARRDRGVEPCSAARRSMPGANAPAGTARRRRRRAGATEEPDHRSRSQSARSGTSRARTRAREIRSGSSRSRAAAAVGRDHQRTAAARRGREAASEPLGAATAAAHSAEVHRRHGGSEEPGKRIAILSDARGTYYGREGEVVEGRYRIVKIGVESIELAYLDGRGRQTIRQTGQ